MSDNYNISDVKNFNPTFDKDNIKDIETKYTDLITDFLLCVIENIVVRNDKYFLFII